MNDGDTHGRARSYYLIDHICIYKYKRIAHIQQNSRWTIWWCVTMDCWIDKQNFYMMMMMAMRMCRSAAYVINNQSTQQTEWKWRLFSNFFKKEKRKKQCIYNWVERYRRRLMRMMSSLGAHETKSVLSNWMTM
jgi:hypothetical protein